MKIIAPVVVLLLSFNAIAAVEWRQAPLIPPMKRVVWMPPVLTVAEIPYGCRTRFDDLLPRACLVLPTETCFIYSARTEAETSLATKRDLARICNGWFHVTTDYPVPDWTLIEGRFPSQSVPKL